MEQTEIVANDLYQYNEREEWQESPDGPLFQTPEKPAGEDQADQLCKLEEMELHALILWLNASELPHWRPILKRSRDGGAFI